MYLVISLLISRAGYGIWLYQFLIIAYRFTFRKDNDSNGGEGIIVYIRNGINARRSYLETNNIACIWLEITVVKSSALLIQK